MSARRKSPGFSTEALARIDSRDMLILQDTSGRVLTDLTKFYETDAAVSGASLEATNRASLEAAYGFDCDEEDRKPFAYQDGVAVIPIHGTLINRFGGSWGFVTGYQYIRRMMNLALEDDDVQLIVYDVDSPGGEAAGCFELAREIMMSRRVKPSLAVVDSTAASGGIALGVAPTAIYAIPSARVGSIGVYRMHVSYEGALKEAGIKVTFAAAGEHKVDGNPYQDLPDAVLNEWREQAGKTWDDFIALVAEARGLSEDDVRATQARIYRADEALAKGLIDAVKTQTEAVSAFLAELADADPLEMEDEEQTMAEPSSKGKVAEATSGLTESDLTKIASMVSSMVATSVSTAIAAQDRKQSITAYAASKGVAELGAKLAANAAITEEEAIAMIDAAAPKGKGKAKVKAPKANNRVEDEDGDEGEGDDEEGDEGEGDEGEGDEGEGDEDGDDEEVSTPRQPKSGKGKAKSGGKRDRVNHFEQAMRSQRSGSAGAANSREGGGRANPLLSAHHMATGANWSAGRK